MTVSVRICSSDADLTRSLEIYNEVWPRRAATPDDVQAWAKASIATADFLAAVDGVDGGSAAGAIATARPGLCLALITVLPPFRRRGIGTALYETVSAWAVDHGLSELETSVESDDPVSLDF